MNEHAQGNLNNKVPLIEVKLHRLMHWAFHQSGNSDLEVHCDAKICLNTKHRHWRFTGTRTSCTGSRSVTRKMHEDFGPTT